MLVVRARADAQLADRAALPVRDGWPPATRRRRSCSSPKGCCWSASNSDVGWVGPRAAAAHITLYVLQLDAPEMDASSPHDLAVTRRRSRSSCARAWTRLAGLAKGDVFRIVAQRRLRVPAPRAGALGLLPPELRARAGRSRRQAAQDQHRHSPQGPHARDRGASSASARRRRAPSDDVVLETLRAPLLAADIPLKLTTYTFQDPDSPKLKIILAADIDRSLNPDGHALARLHDVRRQGQAGVEPAREGHRQSRSIARTRTQKYLGAAVAAPGVYTLKLAVVDETGKRGSVERTFPARINGFGQLHVTDLLIADNSVRGSDGPAAGGRRGFRRRRDSRLRRALLRGRRSSCGTRRS